jgi:PAS domain S-box-containing protein
MQDVTDLGRAESEPHASEARLRTFVGHATDAFFLHDDGLIVVDVNRQACESLGYTREELIGMHPREFDVGLDEASLARVAERVGAGDTVTFESLHRRKDGTVFPVEVRAGSFQQGDRRFRLSLVRDITERRRAEEGLLELKERFRALAESSLVGIYLILENRFRYVNPAMARMFGYTVEELVERLGPPDLVHPDDRALVAENIRRRVEGKIEEIRYEFRGVRKDGSVFPVEVHGRRIELGGRTGVMGALLDNTERRRVEHELRRSQTYLAEAQRLSHTGSFGWDPSSQEVHWSDETYRIFELDRGSSPTLARILERTHPDDRPDVLATIRLAQREGTGLDLEHRIVMPDGSVKHLRVVGHAVTHDPGRRELVGAVMDVTAHKRAEEDRRAHVWFLESMDRVNRAIQGTDDLERMMGDVLDAVLAIFDCDRATLVTEGPELASFRVTAIRARPGCAGDLVPGAEVPGDEHVGVLLRASSAGGAPVQFTPGSAPPLPPEMGERLGIRSILSMPVHPKLGAPERFHHFALAQCSHPRVWAPHEVRLFHEIGRRLGDAMSTLSMLRDLRRSEARLEEAQRLAHVGHWEWDLETDRFTCSDETSSILGLRPEDRPTTSAGFTDRVHPADRHVVQRAIEEVRAGGSRIHLECRVVRPNGELRVVHVRGSVSPDAAASPRRLFGTIQDVTDRKRAEEELRASDSRFRTLVDFAADAFMLHDAGDATVLDVNRQACESLGYAREELIGMTPLDWNPDIDPAALRRITERLGAGEILTFETRHRRKDGTLFPVEVRVRQVQQGGRWFNISLSRDITQRKRAEEERETLRQAQADLARISRVTTMGELTASLAHEIKQPIAAAITNANACIRWLARDRPDLREAREAAARIVTDATRAAQIIDRVRSLYKKDDLRREMVDVNDVIRETLALLRSEASRHSVSIRADLAPNVPSVLGDRVQLQQVLVNLMLNGIEAMNETAGVLTIESGRGPSGEVLITVSDEGVGLPDADTDAIFDAFFTTKPQGTGMGLTISRSIVETHGGRLWATPRRGRGASFHVALPAAVPAAGGARLPAENGGRRT